MTDLEKAIADLRRATPANSPWVAEDFECGFAGPVILALPVVVQAAASGELIPATERDAAVAAAMEAAAALCIQSAQEAKADNGTGWASHSWLMTVARTIQSEITQPQADALARVRAEAVKIKPLVWVRHPTAEIWRCDTLIGTYKVFGIGNYPTWDFDSVSDPNDKTSKRAETHEAAKAAAQADHEARIRAAIGGVE
jgi:type II secretory pathway pseudopilin PulG